MCLTIRVIGAVVCLLSVSPAWGQGIITLRKESYASPVVPGTVTNDLSIDFWGAYSGSQLLIELEAGSIYQHPSGSDVPPTDAMTQLFPEVVYDSFLALDSTRTDNLPQVLTGGGAVNLGGAAVTGGQFDDAGVDVFWYPAPGSDDVDLTDRHGFLTSRITFSDDAQGTWSYLGSAGGIFGIVASERIEDGHMVSSWNGEGDFNDNGQVEGGDLDLTLLNWGDPVPPVPDGWVNDLPRFSVDQDELDKVLLHWGVTENIIRADDVDPAVMGGHLTGLAGDFNGSGQVEQADWDLFYFHEGQPAEPPPAGWVNDLPTGSLITRDDEGARLFLNWGNMATPGQLLVPEPAGLGFWCVGTWVLIARRRHGRGV